MGGSIKNHHKEQIKMVMLKQEETFRYQLHELHRLYRIQMLLMRDPRNAKMEMQRQISDLKPWNEENGITSSEFAAEDCRGEKNSEGMIESLLELTLATGSNRTIQRKKEEEENAMFSSESGSSFSSSSYESGSMKQYRNEWASFEGLKVEQQMKQGALNNPPWLFKCNNNHDMVASSGL